MGRCGHQRVTDLGAWSAGSHCHARNKWHGSAVREGDVLDRGRVHYQILILVPLLLFAPRLVFFILLLLRSPILHVVVEMTAISFIFWSYFWLFYCRLKAHLYHCPVLCFRQHYLLVLLPFYIMLRDGGAVVHTARCSDVVVGVWTMYLYHFLIAQPVGLTTAVNLNFMLCPSDGLAGLIKALIPQAYIWPSYHTPICTVAPIIIALIHSSFLLLGMLACTLFGQQRKGSLAHSKINARAVGRPRKDQ